MSNKRLGKILVILERNAFLDSLSEKLVAHRNIFTFKTHWGLDQANEKAVEFLNFFSSFKIDVSLTFHRKICLPVASRAGKPLQGVSEMRGKILTTIY
jgi:hypothetical protein